MGESGPAGVPQGLGPQATYDQYKALDPTQQQGYVTQYLGLNPNEQQQWLTATGQQDPTGGVNNPNYVAPPAPTAPTRAPASASPWANQPGPSGPIDPNGDNPALFGDWFNAQLDAGQSPGLTPTGTDPGSAYGSYQTPTEQAALMAQYNALSPELQAAYVQRYMQLTPQEQATWRQAFGADPMVGTVGGAASGVPNVSLYGTMADNNQAGTFEDIWAQPWEQEWMAPKQIDSNGPGGTKRYAPREKNPAWVANFGYDGSGGQLGGIGPNGQPWYWAGGAPPAGFVPKPAPAPVQAPAPTIPRYQVPAGWTPGRR